MLDELVANNFANVAAAQSPDLQSLPADRVAAFVKDTNARAHPCAADPNYNKFAFWIRRVGRAADRRTARAVWRDEPR
jgi:hypothetical protein